jgi:hypothetical protein
MQVTYAVVGSCWVDRGGEKGVLPGCPHRPSAVASCRHRPGYELKKAPVLPLPPRVSRVQLPGSGAIFTQYPYFSRTGHSAASGGPFGPAEAGHWLGPHGLTPPGLLRGSPARFFSPICHPLEGPQAELRPRVALNPRGAAPGSGAISLLHPAAAGARQGNRRQRAARATGKVIPEACGTGAPGGYRRQRGQLTAAPGIAVLGMPGLQLGHLRVVRAGSLAGPCQEEACRRW